MASRFKNRKPIEDEPTPESADITEDLGGEIPELAVPTPKKVETGLPLTPEEMTDGGDKPKAEDEEENENSTAPTSAVAPNADVQTQDHTAQAQRPGGDGAGEQIGAMASGIGAGIGAAAAGTAIGLNHLLRPVANAAMASSKKVGHQAIKGAKVAKTKMAGRVQAKATQRLNDQLKLIASQRNAIEKRLDERAVNIGPYAAKIEAAMNDAKLIKDVPSPAERRKRVGLAMEQEYPEVASAEFKKSDADGLRDIETMCGEHAKSLKQLGAMNARIKNADDSTKAAVEDTLRKSVGENGTLERAGQAESLDDKKKKEFNERMEKMLEFIREQLQKFLDFLMENIIRPITGAAPAPK